MNKDRKLALPHPYIAHSSRLRRSMLFVVHQDRLHILHLLRERACVLEFFQQFLLGPCYLMVPRSHLLLPRPEFKRSLATLIFCSFLFNYILQILLQLPRLLLPPLPRLLLRVSHLVSMIVEHRAPQLLLALL